MTMRSLREFAQFVGKSNPPISSRALVDSLCLNINPSSISMREAIALFEEEPFPVAIEAVSVEPRSAVVPFEIGMQITKAKGYILGVRWRIVRDGQQVAVYDLSKCGGGVHQAAHTFSEPGTYTVEGTVRGIGKDGYAEATQSVTVVANPKEVPPQSWRLKLFLGPTELIPGVLRIISVNWKVRPLWSASQVFNLTGPNSEVSLSVPLPGADGRVQVELSFRCAVAGVINGVSFPPREFDGIVDPFPTFIGWEGAGLNAGWFPLWEVVHVDNNIYQVVVVAKLQNIEPSR